MNDDLEDRTDALDQVFHYHDSTKHHYQRYAPGPGYLDWATQPNPFRRYAGARLLALERPPVTNEPLYDDAYVQDRVSPARVTRQTISQLFYDSLALSAWKSTGAARWALRVNPSSGNLHPTEGYLICGPIADLCDVPMVCHYAPKEHALEVRAQFDVGLWDQLCAGITFEDTLRWTDIHSLAGGVEVWPTRLSVLSARCWSRHCRDQYCRRWVGMANQPPR